MASVGISGLGFFVAAYLVGISFGVEGQSKYFMLTSLVVLQSAFDMGASQLLMNSLAYRRHISSGSHNLSDELIKVFRVALHYAKICSFTYAPIFLIVYILAFKLSSITIIQGFILGACSALNMYTTFLLAFFEGVGAVQKSYYLRFVMNVSRTVTLIAGLFFGSGFYAISTSLLVSSALSLAMIFFSKDLRNYLNIVDKSLIRSNLDFSWRHDLFPTQRRLAVSWLSAYVIYQGPVWLSFMSLDSLNSAKFGLSWSIFAGLSAVGSTILASYAAPISSLFGSNMNLEAINLWKKKSLMLISFAIFTGIAFIAVVYFSPTVWFPKDRVLRLSELWLLLLATVINQIIYCIVILGRATGQEKFHTNYFLWMIFMLVVYFVLSQIQLSSLIIILSCTIINLIMLPLFYRIEKHVISIYSANNRHSILE